MKEQLNTLLAQLKDNLITFKEVIELTETYYQHQPTAFKNGDAYNEATQNQAAQYSARMQRKGESASVS